MRLIKSMGYAQAIRLSRQRLIGLRSVYLLAISKLNRPQMLGVATSNLALWRAPPCIDLQIALTGSGVR